MTDASPESFSGAKGGGSGTEFALASTIYLTHSSTKSPRATRRSCSRISPGSREHAAVPVDGALPFAPAPFDIGFLHGLSRSSTDSWCTRPRTKGFPSFG